MLCGKTVALRPVAPSDVELLVSWFNAPAFFDSAAGRWPTRAKEIEAHAAKAPNYNKRGEFLVVLADTRGTPDETPVGHIMFDVPTRFPACRCFEIGFGTHPDHRRKGYATQAARLLIDQLFNAQRCHRIQAHCLADNLASQRVIEGLGMTREGILRGFAYRGGCYNDVCLYSILRPDWADSPSYAKRFGGL